MEEFAAGELDVLVATTIIESGIDNPHTNTLIIEDAQRLRPRADVPAEGPRGPLVHPGLRLLHVPRERASDRGGRRAPHRHQRAPGSGQRHAHRHARSGDPRRRLPAGRRAVRQHVGRGLRPVRPDAQPGRERDPRGRGRLRRAAAGAFRHHREHPRPRLPARGVHSRRRRPGAVVPQAGFAPPPWRRWPPSARICSPRPPRCPRRRPTSSSAHG